MSSKPSPPQSLEKELRRRLHPQVLALREAMHRRLLEMIDLPAIRPEDIQDARFRTHVGKIVDDLLTEYSDSLPYMTSFQEVKKDFLDETLGLGALEELLADDEISGAEVTEIGVVDPDDKLIGFHGL